MFFVYAFHIDCSLLSYKIIHYFVVVLFCYRNCSCLPGNAAHICYIKTGNWEDGALSPGVQNCSIDATSLWSSWQISITEWDSVRTTNHRYSHCYFGRNVIWTPTGGDAHARLSRCSPEFPVDSLFTTVSKWRKERFKRFLWCSVSFIWPE